MANYEVLRLAITWSNATWTIEVTCSERNLRNHRDTGPLAPPAVFRSILCANADHHATLDQHRRRPGPAYPLHTWGDAVEAEAEVAHGGHPHTPVEAAHGHRHTPGEAEVSHGHPHTLIDRVEAAHGLRNLTCS